MIYIGVDPGSKSGAYAIIRIVPEREDDVRVYAWDDGLFIEEMRGVAALAQEFPEKCVACVEKVGAMPKQGISSTWVFAENFGYIQGVLHAFNIPFQLVPPRVWKKEFSLTSDKSKSVEICHRLFPVVKLKRTEKSSKDDNNLAEALLMAEYARRKF